MIAVILTVFLSVHYGLGWWSAATAWIVMECVTPGTVVVAAREQLARRKA